MIYHGHFPQSLLKICAMHARARDHISIRDSIHGSIIVNATEIRLIDHAAFQRLRFIKQAGFIDLAFPGGNHTRYAHSLGAMHMATRIFDNIFPIDTLHAETRARFRQALRLAALCHDMGHGPLSHSSEALMPKVGDRTATHEDYTLRLLTDSPFSEELLRLFSPMDVTPKHITDLIVKDVESTLFMHEGVNFRPILQQIVSSECDADRMDYLQRDSVYCGVNYGKFDADWLIENLIAIERENALFLGIKSRAIFSFEDFLLSRYHMFASVYFHHTPVIFDKMLELHGLESPDGFKLPFDIERYIQVDDIELWSHLRASACPFAKRIVERRPYYLIDEFKLDSENLIEQQSHQEMASKLAEHGISTIQSCSKSLLSKYFGKEANSIFVATSKDIVPLESYTPLYQRYRVPAELHRLFVLPEQKEKALRVLK
jgi:HD superfamily phosphohydrolase